MEPYRRYGPALLRKAERMLQDRDEAKDLSGQHFYSRHLLRDRVNNGQDLYQGDESLFR